MAPPNVTSTTLKRIHREIADLKKEDLGAIKLAPSGDDLFHWSATIPGPEGSVYEGGVFQVEIVLGHDYPFSAPRVAFKTRIYHMNINERGSICIDILKHNWSPALSLFKVILSLSSLLTDPNPKDPLVPSIATEYVRNRVQHDSNARRWTELYARPPSSAVSSSANSKGKASAASAATASGAPRLQSAAPSRPSSARPTAPSRTATPAETITIEDSEDERPGRATATRGAQRAKRKRGAGTDGAVDVDLTAQDSSAARPARRQRVGTSTSGGGTGGSSEVIVIED